MICWFSDEDFWCWDSSLFRMLAAVVHVNRMLHKLGSIVETMMSLAATSFFLQFLIAAVAASDTGVVWVGHTSFPSTTSKSSCFSKMMLTRIFQREKFVPSRRGTWVRSLAVISVEKTLISGPITCWQKLRTETIGSKEENCISTLNWQSSETD